MAFQPPHDFANIRRDDSLPALVAGRGLSIGIAPDVADLDSKRAMVEAELKGKLGAQPIVCADGADFYSWAQEIVDRLKGNGEDYPKLQLARALGLTTEKRWFCKTQLGIHRTSARHRVIARFARESRWASIWTFNWDCLIEAALESIGLERDRISFEQPWVTGYYTFITVADYGKDVSGRVAVHKPHGCAYALSVAETLLASGQNPGDLDRFLVTKAELEKVPDPSDPNYAAFDAKMSESFFDKPLVIVGWSASEGYLLRFLETHEQRLRQYPNQRDRLSIVNPSFKEPAHLRVAKIYDVTKEASYFAVERDGDLFTTDWLFLWMQTLYALEILANWTTGETSARVKQLMRDEQEAKYSDFVSQWVDYFLPAWVRMCWRAGLVPIRHNDGRAFEPHRVRMEKRDEHIPWRFGDSERPELQAAARILLAANDRMSDWNVTKYPGAFWKESSLELRIAVPVWTEPNEFNALASIRPLLETVKQNMGFIRGVAIILVTLDDHPIANDVLTRYKLLTGRFLRLPQFLAGENIGILKLNEL